MAGIEWANGSHQLSQQFMWMAMSPEMIMLRFLSWQEYAGCGVYDPVPIGESSA